MALLISSLLTLYQIFLRMPLAVTVMHQVSEEIQLRKLFYVSEIQLLDIID